MPEKNQWPSLFVLLLRILHRQTPCLILEVLTRLGRCVWQLQWPLAAEAANIPTTHSH